jgi:translation initiation factor 3 subunit L
MTHHGTYLAPSLTLPPYRADPTQSMVHVEETTSHRRFAGFFIRNAEHAQRVFNTIRAAPLPSATRRPQVPNQNRDQSQTQGQTPGQAGAKPGAGAWQPRRARVAAQ